MAKRKNLFLKQLKKNNINQGGEIKFRVMGENQTDQQFYKDRQKRAKVSLILGIISVMLPMLGISNYAYLEGTPPQFLALFGRHVYHCCAGGLCDLILPLLTPFFSIVALVLGIIGLQSPKKKMAFWGIIFSLIGLLEFIWFVIVALGPLFASF